MTIISQKYLSLAISLLFLFTFSVAIPVSPFESQNLNSHDKNVVRGLDQVSGLESMLVETHLARDLLKGEEQNIKAADRVDAALDELQESFEQLLESFEEEKRDSSWAEDIVTKIGLSDKSIEKIDRALAEKSNPDYKDLIDNLNKKGQEAVSKADKSFFELLTARNGLEQLHKIDDVHDAVVQFQSRSEDLEEKLESNNTPIDWVSKLSMSLGSIIDSLETMAKENEVESMMIERRK